MDAPQAAAVEGASIAALQSRARKFGARLIRLVVGPDVETDPRYLAAKRWTQKFEGATLNADDLVELGEKKYEQVHGYNQILEAKAGQLFTVATALLTLLLAAICQQQVALGPSLPAIASLLVAQLALVRIIAPTAIKTSPSPQVLLEWRRRGLAVPVELLKMLHLANEGLRVVCNWKATLVRVAAWAIVVALVAALLPLVLMSPESPGPAR